MVKQAYCDDCLHKRICKYEKQVRELEENPPAVPALNAGGPKISYRVECDHKNRLMNIVSTEV